MGDDVWLLAQKKLRSWIARWREARIHAIPRSPDRQHAFRVSLLQLELSARGGIDRACRDWIDGQRLPMKRLFAYNTDWAALLYDRFAEAERFCSQRLDNAPAAAATAAQALTFLLTDHWSEGGFEHWRDLIDE